MRPITDIRRDRLRQLIDEVAEGNQAKFAEMIGKSRAYVGFWLTDPAKPHAKAMGHEEARRVEARFGKPAGWLDTDGQSQAAIPDPDRLGHALTAIEKVAQSRSLMLEGRLGTFKDLLAYAYALQDDEDLFPSGISDDTPTAEREKYDKRVDDELGGMIKRGKIEVARKPAAARAAKSGPSKAKGKKAGSRRA